MNPPTLSDGRLTTHLPAEPASTRRARRFVVEALSGWSCSHLSENAALLTSELVTNAVLHAHSEVDLRVTRTDGGVLIEVMDEDPSPVEPSPAPLYATHGRGLVLVDALARDWGIEPRTPGKSVWFELSG
ncbi:MAG TPA: ATP-binding protein [Acidimicrobiia bacterium]|nr:ATP-binding protein [Acidimicrobiia bacterium]